MPKGFKIISLKEPIYIPSVFEQIIARPDNYLKMSRGIKGAHPESESDKIAVVLSEIIICLVSSSPIIVMLFTSTVLFFLQYFHLIRVLNPKNFGNGSSGHLMPKGFKIISSEGTNLHSFSF